MWVEFLATAGYEAVHWSDVGERNAPDREILEHAQRNGQVILTQDLDFGALLAVGGLATPTVIQFRAQAVLPSDVGEQLLASLEVTRSYLETGALVTVDPRPFAGHRARASLGPRYVGRTPVRCAANTMMVGGSLD